MKQRKPLDSKVLVALVSIAATTEWPLRSGRFISVPEIDRAKFFTVEDARWSINVGQSPLIDRLVTLLQE